MQNICWRTLFYRDSQNDVSDLKHLLKEKYYVYRYQIYTINISNSAFLPCLLSSVYAPRIALHTSKRQLFPAKYSAASGAQFLQQSFECNTSGS
jgi:hypothetical protein